MSAKSTRLRQIDESLAIEKRLNIKLVISGVTESVRFFSPPPLVSNCGTLVRSYAGRRCSRDTLVAALLHPVGADG